MSNSNISNNTQVTVDVLPSEPVSTDGQVSETPKPVENVWQKRAHAHKLSENGSPQGKGKGKGSTYVRKDRPPREGDQSTYVKRDRPPREGDQSTYVKRDRPPREGDQSTYVKRDRPPREGDQSTYVKKELSPEEKAVRDEKTKAFNLAQDAVIKMCVDRCSPKIREDIKSNLAYQVYYSRTLVMDVQDDNIVVEVDGNKHCYSLKRFLDNRFFQRKLRDEYATFLPDAWIRLFEGRDEGTYCIGVQKRKE